MTFPGLIQRISLVVLSHYDLVSRRGFKFVLNSNLYLLVYYPSLTARLSIILHTIKVKKCHIQGDIARLISHLYNFHIHYIHFHKNYVRWTSQELFTCFANKESAKGEVICSRILSWLSARLHSFPCYATSVCEKEHQTRALLSRQRQIAAMPEAGVH